MMVDYRPCRTGLTAAPLLWSTLEVYKPKAASRDEGQNGQFRCFLEKLDLKLV